MRRTIKRGEIYLADLNPVIGSEQGGIRPVLIIQNDVGNKYSPTVIVAAITGKDKKYLPTHITIKTQALPDVSTVLLEQIRTVDKSRLIKKLGKIQKDDMYRITDGLRKSIDI